MRRLVVAGPGLLAGERVDGVPVGVAALRDFATATNTGVLNTWGLKGLFRWDSPFHLGTGGLQARDFDLAGVSDAELVLAVGIDPDESPWELLGAVERVGAEELPGWAPRLERFPAEPSRSRLYTELSGALAPLYASDAVPLNPARAAADLAASLPPGGVLTAEPGLVGLWIARTFPTTVLGSVVVPAARGSHWFDVAGATVAVVPGPLDDASLAAIDEARSAGRNLLVIVWDTDGDPAALAPALQASGVRVVPVAVDLSWTRVLTDVAGPLRAWT